jgi:hypothetical protein
MVSQNRRARTGYAPTNATTLSSGVILGKLVRGETLAGSGGGRTASAAVGLGVAIVGIALLDSAAIAGPTQPAGRWWCSVTHVNGLT